jgi:UDP-N-acetylmuramyl tripeptide synthase
MYNIYNTLASVLIAECLGITREESLASLKEFTPAFGRLEEQTYQGKKVRIVLSKNPTGFNQSIRTALSHDTLGSMLLVLNDQIPDGRDISWIWDVDFEMLRQRDVPIVVSGERVYDLAVRMEHAGILSTQLVVEPDVTKALELAAVKAQNNKEVWVLPTYSAMLQVRKVITGKALVSP